MAKAGDLDGYWERYLAEECRHRLEQVPPAGSDPVARRSRAMAPLVAEALELQIRDIDDVERFVRLAFLPPALLTDPWVHSVLSDVLARTDLSSRWRLDFIDLHVLGPSLVEQRAAPAKPRR